MLIMADTVHTVGDVVAELDGRQPLSTKADGRTLVYGRENCQAFVQKFGPPTKKAPPYVMVANADSYAWFATSRFFSEQFGRTITKRDDDGAGGSTDEFIMDIEQAIADPNYLCALNSQPLGEDCLNIDVVSDSNTIDLASHACFASGTRKWCDIYTSDSCQISVGWDTTSFPAGPRLDNSQLADAVSGAPNFTEATCTPFFQDFPQTCAPGSNICSVAHVVCVKAVGQDCRP
jgi:hypothetical protein